MDTLDLTNPLSTVQLLPIINTSPPTMDTLDFIYPLSTVQLIPVITYLNLLSDFLFINNYLLENDQHKPIPIVNGLYEYLEDHQGSQTMMLDLIRNLLHGSDLYGEYNNEQVDQVFVNTMFDYIISSLVFAKYGNIYGFLADTIRQEENLQFYYILERVKENLRKAEFENEYGNSSTLSKLSISRIFNDLLMPLFPKPMMTNLNLLSLDYIFAQAGSMYLRLGRLNETYYSNFENLTSSNNDNDIFQEYRVIGYIVENLLHHKIIDPIVIKIFALPALFHYVSKEQETKNETIEKVIFNPHHWEAAYDYFFTYIENAFTKIDNQLKNDYTHQLHKMFTNFHSRAKFAKLILELKCQFLNKHYRETRIPVYIDNADYFECRSGDVLPNINEWFADQVHDFGEIYEKYDLEMTTNIFNDSLIELRGIIIKLVLTSNKVSDSTLNNSEYLSYDLLEFFNTNNQTLDYYALLRLDYSVTLIKESDDPVNFQKIIGPSLDDYKRSAKRIILKFANETTQQLSEELMKYKKDRFKSYLNYSQNNFNHHEWWREFGLSLLPHYPCLTNYTEDYHEIEDYFCERENIRFLNKFQEDVSLNLIDRKTKSLLLSLGSDIKTIFINNIIDEYIIDEIERANGILIPSLKKTTLKTVYQKFSLQIEEPEMETLGTTQDEIKFMENVILHLEWKSNRFYMKVKNMLIKMKIMNVKYPLKIGEIKDRKLNHSLFVNSWNGLSGYGYKFIGINKNDNKTPIIAQLRTEYEFKNKILITPIYDSELTNSSKKEKEYIKLNNEMLESENDVLFIVSIQNLSNFQQITLKTNQEILRTGNKSQDLVYELDNQLRRNITKISFHGISYHNHNDDKCNVNAYLQKTKDSSLCSRHWCYIDKTDHDRMIIRDLLKHQKDENLVLEYQIHEILKKYTFSNDSTMRFFFKNWMNDKQFRNSYWSKNNIVDKSGLLNKLLYETRLENGIITNTKGEMRINSIYTYRERYKIEDERTLENIIKDYNDQQADYTIMFEDYYAVRNFATTGYRRINADTREAKLMKNALYKLSIRQAHDLEEEFDLKLFYFDSIPIDIFQREYMKDLQDIYWGKSIILQKFTLASTNEESAVRFGVHPENGFKNILFEMKFYGPYLRAKIDVEVKHTVSFREKKVILPPGSEFFIEKLGTGPIKKIGNYFKVTLVYKLKYCENYNRYKDIMTQIAETKL
ncbi:uncharacterized protein LOC122506122 [Leptopilina heterotoma]|uniref:uncharacterized protein LOC122506122 n=1 Tax=Leptopilina heterotoma TaxID=63436 RepID=UPI001CA82D84|nr:uncharacterized protein LOC122506122 [Leptopilina heterotoma]